MTSVSVRDLTLKFGSLEVLRTLNLDISEGEFLVLLGPSGCGKSTLLNCIAGLLDISDGQIFISGKNVTWEEPKDRGIGMVFQSYALYPQMTVEKNLSFGLQIAGVPKDEIARRIARASEILQIQPLLKRKPSQLSGGQRQRVAIGRALVRDVDVFLFDEPLSNLDAKLRAELRVELKRLHQNLKNTMIYVTHDQIEALTLADRIAVMKGGIIQQLDEPLTIYNRPVNLFVAGFIGSPSMNFLPGRIIGTGDQARVDLGQGLSVPLAGYEAGGPVGDGLDVVFGVRPEHLTVTREPTSGPSLPAVVELVEPMGADSLVWLRLGPHAMSVRTESTVKLLPGDAVNVTFDLHHASLFDASTEERI
ncbi:ABC transporter ATP-binding protein [Roseibium suaedae]|uniref:Carbohydrate ABC transporter ATP-binding protein, CUT1 family n=1 Tax=Roseibium suaedae TaxID=735517 RepID=A0A1M7LII4_9HYPH|nr:ABC transporter ATP-binding protein [Roseibium suaedae]SHM77798.1 carbohydrate ABC transporter ATP-binding protein, CUT1 family [Roseibium suaedae]